MSTPLHYLTQYSATEENPLILHQNRFFKMVFNGRFHYLEAVKYGQGVVIIPVVEGDQYILVKQIRVPALGVSLEFPRGGVDPGEAKEDAVVRELKEETGASNITSIKYLGNIFPESATINGSIHIYLVKLRGIEKYLQEDRNEIDSIHIISESQLKQYIKDGVIKDGITCAAYALLKAQ